jgi:hypothetical protein
MLEQSPDAFVDKLERQFRRQKRLRTLLLDLAMSSVVIVAPSTAHIMFEEIHRTDTLPHD